MVRTGNATDHHRLRVVQRAALAEPAPALLAAAVETGPPALLVADDTDPVSGSAVEPGGGEVSEPVGYAIVLGDGPSYLAELAVHPDRQSEGLGSALLAAVQDRAGGAVRVTARADDRRVLSFYRRHGFERVESLPAFFADCDGVALVSHPES